MKRKVKAWVVYEVGQGEPVEFRSIEHTREDARYEVQATVRLGGYEYGTFDSRPCVVTYDDGKPARKARRKGRAGK